jgi:hypothetical protein
MVHPVRIFSREMPQSIKKGLRFVSPMSPQVEHLKKIGEDNESQLITRIIGYIRTNRNMRKEYLNARGTLQKQLLISELKRLDMTIDTIEARKRDLVIMLEREMNGMRRRLDSAFHEHIIWTCLPGLEGIGMRTTRAIVNTCFDGTLDSLGRAHGVKGVGQAKQRAIDSWRKEIASELPGLRREGFPGRNRITRECSVYIGEIEAQMDDLSIELMEKRSLRSQVSNALEPLIAVDFSAFRRSSLEMDGKSGWRSDIMDRYHRGLYPDGEPKPKWFEDIEDEFGRTSRGMLPVQSEA